MGNEIIVEVVGKLDAIEKSLDNLEKNVEKKGTAIGAGLVAGITSSIATTGIKAIGKIGQVLGDTFGKAIEEASNAGKALQLFNSSLAQAGHFSEEASKKFEDFASALQKTTGVSDDLITSNASILVSLGKLSGDGLERATKAAVDFAATGRISLEGAFDAIAKAATGNEAALGRFGVKVDESIPKSEKFAVALEKLEHRFGGLAAAQVNTFAGVENLISVNFHDILENLGKFVTQSPVVIALGKEIAKAFGAFADTLKLLGGQDILGTVIKNILAFGQTVVTYVIAPLEFAGNVVNAFAQTIAALGVAMVSPAGAIQQLKAVGDSFKEIMDFSFSGSVSGFITNLQNAAENAAPILEGIKNNTAATANEVSDVINKASQKISQSIQQGVINSISVGAQAIGASLIKGGKAFDNFKNQVLAIIGDMAIQIGSTLVGIGIGIDALKVALGTLSGGVAIAAGLALIAIGGLLKSLSAGTPGEGTGVGGGVGTGPGGPAVGGGEFGVAPEIAAGQAGTRVNVNIAGNVLDRRETGLAIAEVIQQHFDNNGQLIAGAAV